MIDTINLHEKLKLHFGFDTFKGNQESIITNLLNGNDGFVLMPTGGGKSLCYQLPALLMEGTAIVISPLIALMKNQVDAMRNFSDEDSVAHFMNSSLNKTEIDQVKSDVSEGKCKVLYVAPESLTKSETIQFLKTVKISFYAVDEAHCISEWGHDFRPEYRRIRPIIDEIGIKPIIALTATATPKVQDDIMKNLGIKNKETSLFKSSFNRPNLYYEIRPKNENSERDIIRYIKQNAGKSGIIYCMTRKEVDDLAELLKANQIKALPYHAGMENDLRAQTQDAFIKEEIDVIVATIAFGMGIDKPDVRYVIHHSMPKSLEGYYQETGRAGRDGGEGQCIGYYSEKDMIRLEKLMHDKPVAEKEIGHLLIKETQSFAETMGCRRKMLLHYFGEDYKNDECGNCDNCRKPKRKVDAKELLENVIECILDLKEKFQPDYVVNVLEGVTNDDILSYQHDMLESYGSGKDEAPEVWHAVIRQGLIEKYLMKDMDSYGVLKVTNIGKRFLNKPKPFSIYVDSDEDESEDEIELKGVGASAAADEELYSMLKDLRRKVANRHNLPPYVIFQEPSLEAMATTYPITLEELQNVPGVGAGKAKRYGEEFIALIKRHVEEKEIIRPEDFRFRTVADKSKRKLDIIKGIDRKIDLDELAEGLKMGFDELLDEIERILNAGTNLKIDYFLHNVMEQEDIDELFDWFKQDQTGDLEKAYKEWCPAYKEEEIRLVKIKFISDMAH